MREYKFRAWDKKYKAMYYNIQYYSDYSNLPSYENVDYNSKLTHIKEILDIGNFYEFLENENFIVMQYTGLKDKNGKDVYEGDVLTICNGSINGYKLLEKNRGVIFKDGSFNIPIFDFDSTHYFEVIGNIYDNPELLEV